MTWRLAETLIQLRRQVNDALPSRDKSSDGSIGDENHANRNSDHNPWVNGGVVTAIDITHDPRNGFDSYKFADYLRTLKDKRIKYVISNGRIFSSQTSPWQWRKYGGSNKHDHHVHISVLPDKALYDSRTPWDLDGFGFKPVKSAPPVPAVTVLSKGARGAAVEELQGLLKIGIDGHFGPNTEDAVRFFQKTNGLETDGIVGIYTWERLRKGK
jgi:peptidoglycan hydrolase-like protein with peptidoglycan-binding domain